MIWELVSVVSACVFLIYAFYCHFGTNIRKLNKLPGPRAWPLFGNGLDIIVSSERLFELIREWQVYGDLVRMWSLHIRVLLIYGPAEAEKILTTTKFNEKRIPYNFIQPWLCEGLLVSNGMKWHHRRKLLTPAFHFDILKQFMKTFVDQSNALVAKLRLEVGKERINPVQFITESTLNVMCETAMGARNEKGVDKNITDYLKSIHEFGECLVYRVTRVLFHLDWTYYFTFDRLKRDDAVKKLHKFSENVIEERRVYRKKFGFNNNPANDGGVYGKKRMAMLDLLLENESAGQIDKLGVREEVDTFMFEGHDTTAMALSFFFMRIANESEAQNRIYEELQTIFGEDERDPSVQDLNDMKYLECCIKESLRLYPSVPHIMRYLSEDVELGGYTVPSGTVCNISIYDIHRRPDLYPEPERFIPERFLPENCNNRPRYAFIPFSAGPRNCIGQKFAMMEMKTLISGVLRRLKLEPVTRVEDIVFSADIVLRTKDPYYVKVSDRRQNKSSVCPPVPVGHGGHAVVYVDTSS